MPPPPKPSKSWMEDQTPEQMDLFEASSRLEKVMMAYGRTLSRFWFVFAPFVLCLLGFFNLGWTQVLLLVLPPPFGRPPSAVRTASLLDATHHRPTPSRPRWR